MKHAGIPRSVCLAAAVLLVAGCGLQQDIAQKVGAGAGGGIGRKAPALQGTMLDGSQLDPAALHGKVAVIDFWASWCGPCRAQQPQLDSLARTYAQRGVVFIGVDIRDDNAAGRAYQSRFSVPYDSVADPSADLATAWEVPAPPTTVVVDGAGTVRARVLGGIDAAKTGTLLDSLLESSP